MIVSIAVFFAVLAVLVLAHEFGHFLAARRKKVKVEEFGFGFPPRLFAVRRGETLYSFNLLPLGGFVKIFGEDSVESSDPKNFASRSVSQRLAIIGAGVLFNVILAYFLYSFVLWLGMPVDSSDPLWGKEAKDQRIAVIGVIPSSPASAVGLKEGDKIVELKSGSRVIQPAEIQEVRDFTRENKGSAINVSVLRNGKELDFTVNLPQDRLDSEGLLGIAMAKIGILKKPIHQALFYAAHMTWSAAVNTLKGFIFILSLLFSGKSVSGMVSGPVGIFSIISSSVNFGYLYVALLTATLSVNLALINLFPIPALDGGRILFLLIEAFRGKPISRKITGFAHSLGFVILILLMLVITYYDFKFRL